MEKILLGLAAGLALISSGSLLAKDEGIRGLGRVMGGVSTVSQGLFLLSLSLSRRKRKMPGSATLFSTVIVLTGVVTLGSGVRKYLRRNSPSELKERL
jgi:hypothetical protein